MIKKKTEKENLENYRGLLRRLIFFIALGAIFMAFGWTSKTLKAENIGKAQLVNMEEETIPITSENIAPLPPFQQKHVAHFDKKTDIINMESNENIQIDIQKLPEGKEDTIFFVVEEMPIFPGGDTALKSWLATHVKYPAEAIKNNIQGQVFVRFVITASGKVDKVQIARGADPLLNAEAIRVVKMLPKWKPGYQRHKPVSVWFTVPINFNLK